MASGSRFSSETMKALRSQKKPLDVLIIGASGAGKTELLRAFYGELGAQVPEELESYFRHGGRHVSRMSGTKHVTGKNATGNVNDSKALYKGKSAFGFGTGNATLDPRATDKNYDSIDFTDHESSVSVYGSAQ